ncbi:TIGR03862 family flavoprotein [Paracoccus sp. (in: a-proteobacteria)]|uniref:NAD(P)/FAD-dependent oxidoreductase n=1 Tax=Paracoccus sp. TaxID=267 RepID=UPI0026DF43E4|nr:TIGR03862 family flavoprotein [Paracoccus sp. (in: a-proteobacteria)]MDO5368803.1 TIGR03862 family flavoprotein [Paracoccus sp. (in: a-proteobacteria)]
MEEVPALVIGAGPAGLMAAEMLSAAGHPVVIAEAMPSPARKFLMAGKSGLNLTRDEAAGVFAARLQGGAAPASLRDTPPGYFGEEELRAIVAEFGPAEVMEWARGLGVELFTGSTGRVFPVRMKASPLLRAWLARLNGRDVTLRTRWRWTGFRGGLAFDTPEGPRTIRAGVTVLALGGASWPRLGSDAAWVPWLRDAGVAVAPFRPANMGFRVDWSPVMAPLQGAAVKGTRLSAGTLESRGEWVITRAGIEGGAIYEISAALRDGAAGEIDLMPDLGPEVLAARLARPRGRLSVGNWLRRVLRDPVKVALLMEWGKPLPADAATLAARIKALPLRHAGPMGLERAISSAGGIKAEALTDGLELRALPGIFAAGEMLDWEAPTGGYLLTACLATGRHAGLAAARHLRQRA